MVDSVSKVRRWVAGMAALSLAGAVAVVGSPGAVAAAAPTDGTFTVGLAQDVDSLNPFTGYTVAAYEIYQLIYPVLTGNAVSDLAPTPAFAESWTTSPDGKTWTFTTRSGATWSDGVPMTARDAAYTFTRILNGTQEKVNYGAAVKDLVSAKATNDTTLVMTFKNPTPVALQLGVYIIPEHIWKAIDGKAVVSYANEPTADKPIVGGGPFTLVERRSGQFTRLEANPSWYGTKPSFKELVFRVYKNSDAIAQALRKGEIDFASDLDPTIWKSLANVDGIASVRSINSTFSELAFNSGAALADGTPIGDGNAALKDPKVRVALSWAVDRAGLVERVLQGYGSAGASIIPPLYPLLHYVPPADKVIGFDLERAKSLLDAAGYQPGGDGIRVGPGGTRLSLRLFPRQESEASQRAAEFIRGWFADIGVEVRVRVVSESALTDLIGKGEYDMFLWGWQVAPDPDYQLSTMTCGQRSLKSGDEITPGLSDSFFCDPQYDNLFAEQARTVDPQARARIVQQMQAILYDAAPYAVTWYDDSLSAYRSDRWQNFTAQPAPDGLLLFQYGVWSYLSIRPAGSPPPTDTPAPTGTATGTAAPSPTSTATATASAAPQPAPESGGIPTGLIVGAGAGLLVVLGLGLVVGRRMGRSDADVE